MGGRIISVAVKPGQAVKKGDLLHALVYEAMKMENDVNSDKGSHRKTRIRQT